MHASGLHTLDYAVFFLYFFIVAGYGYWIYRRKQMNNTANDYFLAEGALTYWAIGASLIASNISAEHFIGMSGSGFAIGLAISTYEWMSAATLIVVAVFFIPVYLKNRIYTMPQFLRERYSPLVATLMAVFWLLLYVFVNLTSILYLGALALELSVGLDFNVAIWGLSVFAIAITLGGMRVIGYTDVIQVVVLILGGLATVYLALNMVAEHFGSSGIISGLALLREKAPSHFHMILPKEHPYYKDLPGLTVLIGAMWVNNLNYWGLQSIYYSTHARRRPEHCAQGYSVCRFSQIAHSGDRGAAGYFCLHPALGRHVSGRDGRRQWHRKTRLRLPYPAPTTPGRDERRRICSPHCSHRGFPGRQSKQYRHHFFPRYLQAVF
jgi:uncharacterized sodium:solute symporter family permease YidK